jgi:acyl-coenzyme A synthetase/AMP-(fatty) acid ligase
MVKRRGYRIELGEIEAALYRHEEVGEAAVVALPDEEVGVRVKAFLAWSGSAKPSVVRMKQFCAEQLPLYMIPDEFAFRDALPKTSTDKIDYQRLLSADP